LILELSNSASELVYEPLPQDDPKQRCPDITRAREVLGWEPRIAATQGLSRTLGWFAERNAERHARSEAERDTGRAAG
jgi:nucleoside-diphosphate-sugar epimerase